MYICLTFFLSQLTSFCSVLMSVMTMLAHINAISVPLTALSHALNAAQIFFTIIDAPKPRTSGLREPDVSVSNDIVFEKVNFAYPTRHDVKVLEGLSLRLEKGKTTAIVGPSGSGKSTIIGLVLRWYELGGVDPVVCFTRQQIAQLYSNQPCLF
jgi:ATP-binding cassette subfamily B (MDR/TAP) protein 1